MLGQSLRTLGQSLRTLGQSLRIVVPLASDVFV